MAAACFQETQRVVASLYVYKLNLLFVAHMQKSVHPHHSFTHSWYRPPSPPFRTHRPTENINKMIVWVSKNIHSTPQSTVSCCIHFVKNGENAKRVRIILSHFAFVYNRHVQVHSNILYIIYMCVYMQYGMMAYRARSP